MKSPLFYEGLFFLEYNHPATTIEQQKNLLWSRGITSNNDLLEHWLKTVGYYRLSAYWLMWEYPPINGAARSKKFKPSTNFKQIRDLYIFDRELRLLVMEAIDRIEISLRARWTNRFSLAHGAHGHLKWQNFTNKQGHDDLIRKLKFSVQRSKEEFIKHYQTKYTKPKLPPLWASSELMSLGELSKWYALTKDNKVKSEIAKDLGFPNIKTFVGALQLLAYVRNICAHHGRLWNRKTVKRCPKIRKMSRDLQFISTGKQLGVDNSMYNALTLIAHTLLAQSPDSTFATRLANLARKQPNWQIKVMGFPADWPRRPIWRKNPKIVWWRRPIKWLNRSLGSD